MPALNIKELGGFAGIVLALLGLVWQAAQQSKDITDQGARLTRVESSQAKDHDDVTQLKSGVAFLVDAEKVRQMRTGK